MEMTAEKGFPIGTILLNRYRIEREIDAGAMSHVYIAIDQWQPENFAIVKTPIAELLEDEWVGKKIKQEAESLARLNHPNIIKLLGHGDYQQHPYVILEYAGGCTLREIMTEMPTNLSRAARLFMQITEAVEHAHSRDIFHRDLKPENIMVERAGEEDESVKIIDFGIARIGNSFFSNGVDTRYRIGTPHYLSPNRLNHDPDDRADDIYALGLIVYEMVTGINPLTQARNFNELSEIQESIQPPDRLNPRLSKDAGREIVRALSLTQVNRHDSARKFGTLFYNAVQRYEEMKAAKTVPIIKPVGISLEPGAPALEPMKPTIEPTAPAVTVDDEFPTREAKKNTPEQTAGNSGDFPTTRYNGAELFTPITPGERCLLAGNSDAAIAFYDEQLAQDPRSDLSYARRAMALLLKKEYDRAALDCQEAIGLNPRNDFAYLIRGIIYRLKLKTAEAEAELLKAVEINPNNVEAALLLGDIHISRNEAEKALGYYDHICRVNPHFSWVYTSRGNFYYDKGDFRAAVKDFSAAIKFNPELAWNFFRRGKALARSNQETLAIEDLTEAIKLNPKNTTFYNDRARLYFKVGNHSEALADFNRVKELTARKSFVADENLSEGIDKKSGLASLIEYLKQVLIGRAA